MPNQDDGAYNKYKSVKSSACLKVTPYQTSLFEAHTLHETIILYDLSTVRLVAPLGIFFCFEKPGYEFGHILALLVISKFRTIHVSILLS